MHSVTTAKTEATAPGFDEGCGRLMKVEFSYNKKASNGSTRPPTLSGCNSLPTGAAF